MVSFTFLLELKCALAFSVRISFFQMLTLRCGKICPMLKSWYSLIGYREQLDSLMKLKWPALSYESVPWALHKPLCNLLGCSPIGSPPNRASSLSVIDKEQIQEPINADLVGRSVASKEELESTREDGELPSLAPVASVVSDIKLTPKESNLDHSRELTLISKSIISPISKIKSLSFRKNDEDSDLLLDIDGDMDEPSYVEPEEEYLVPFQDVAGNSWVDYGVREYSLVLTRNVGTDKRSMRLESKVSLCCFVLIHQTFVSSS